MLALTLLIAFSLPFDAVYGSDGPRGFFREVYRRIDKSLQQSQPLAKEEKPAAEPRRRAIYVGASWCGPCNQVKGSTFPVLRQYGWSISGQAGDHIQTFDSDESPEIVSKHRITSLPTVIILDGDVEVDRLIGYFEPKAFTDSFYSGNQKEE